MNRELFSRKSIPLRANVYFLQYSWFVGVSSVNPCQNMLTLLAVWIGYVTILQKWWESTAEGHFTERVVFWFGLANIPLLVIAWMITFSVLSGANITSSRKSNLALHIVGPWVMNSSIGIIFPASVIPLIVTSARTGQGWIKINNAVAAVYAQAGRDALTFNEVLTPSQVQAMVVQMYEEGYALLLQPWDELLELYRASMICFTVAVAILCVVRHFDPFSFQTEVGTELNTMLRSISAVVSCCWHHCGCPKTRTRRLCGRTPQSWLHCAPSPQALAHWTPADLNQSSPRNTTTLALKTKDSHRSSKAGGWIGT